MNYHIQEKKHELTEGYFMLIMKYGVLFLLGWMLALLVIYTYPCFVWEGDKYPPFLKFLNDYHILSWIFVVILFAWYTYRKYNNYKLGLLTDITFDEPSQQYRLVLIHPLHGKPIEINVSKDDFNIIKLPQKNTWSGNKICYEFYNNKELITTLTPTRTAWKLNSDFEEFIQFLETTSNH